MIVVDCSVLVAALAGVDPLSSAIARRLDGERLLAPELIDVEFANALRGLVRGGKVTIEQAERAMEAAVTFPLERVPHRPLMTRLWELRDNLTAYDATYVALAEVLETSLLTGDRRIRDAPGVRCVVEMIA